MPKTQLDSFICFNRTTTCDRHRRTDGHGAVASTALAYRRGRLTGSRDGSARCLAVYRRRTCARRTAVHREWSPGWRTRRAREQPAQTGIGKKVKVPILDYRAEDF